jgi:hypothetical protein
MPKEERLRQEIECSAILVTFCERTVEGDLTAHKEDEQGDKSPHDLLLEGDPALGRCDLREDAHYRADKLEETNHFDSRSTRDEHM